MRQLYEELYKTALNNLSFLIPVKGTRYDEQTNVRMMLVGRALNGWYEKKERLGDYNDKQDFAEGAIHILEKETGFCKRFPEIKDRAGMTPFWRTSKEIYEALAKKEADDWYENIVWYNLYPIAPQIKGNPSDGFCEGIAKISAKLLEEYILRFNPTHILFVTGWDWFKEIYKLMDPELLPGLQEERARESLVAAKGICAGRRVAVTKRPEYKLRKEYIEQTTKAFTSPMVNRVGIFFCVEGKLLLHSCSLEDAAPYGDFLNYPMSHDEVWARNYQHRFKVDFDYWPRGRVIYNRAENKYLLYYDQCMEAQARALAKCFGDVSVELQRDEHYQCHGCNPNYSYICWSK